MLPRVLGSKASASGLNDTMTLGRLSGGDEMFGAISDQIPPAHLFQCFAQQRPIIGVVVTQKRFVQATLTQLFHSAQ